MKVLLSLLAVLLVAVIGFVGLTLYKKSAPPPVSSSVQQKIAVAAINGPSDPVKVPDALLQAIERNKDTIAWIQIPDTDINNSVVQAKDNLYYERRNEAQEYEVYGCYFADYECSLGEPSTLKPNTIIYGHSSPGDDPNGKRFSQLFRFTDIEFAKKHPCIFINTVDGRLAFEIFSIFYTDINFDYIQVNIKDDEMLKIANKGVELSIYDYPNKPVEGDKILTLSTCTEKFGTDGNHRFVIQAKLLKDGALEPDNMEITAK
ncbi:MAG: class B sortase [Oscillospiraceae bacterium]